MASHLGAEEVVANDENPLMTVRPRKDDEKIFLMPAHFGSPIWGGGEPYPDPPDEAHYGEVTAISIQYLTDGEKLLQYLPRPFELSGRPVVTVAYAMNRKINWLAGAEYNIVKVSVRATYRGRGETVTGDYMLVLWENLTDPILTGREKQGMPKIYGDIEDHSIFDGVWSTTLSNRGQTLLNIEASDLTTMAGDELEKLKANGLDGTMLGWKHIPGETSGSEPMLSYATEFPTSTKIQSAWSAKGHLQWRPQQWKDNPTQAHIVNALHSLPVKSIESCTVTEASKILKVGKVRRLH